MGSFIESSQSEADRLRAAKQSIMTIVHEFRKHPKSQWSTLFAEVSLILEAEHAQPTKLRVPGPRGSHVQPVPRKDVAESSGGSGSNADRAETVLRGAPNGVTPTQLGAAVYGADDERGTHKARAVVHFLQHKRGVPIVRTADGRWMVRQIAETIPKGTVAR